jgi:acetyl-CoA carboxylase beta subunit
MPSPGGSSVQVKHLNFITRSVAAAQNFKAAYDAMVALRAEWDSLAYTTAIVNSDFTGGSVYMVAADLQAFYTAQGNLVTYWAAGNGTNISALIP